MKTGDIVRDGQGRAFQIGQLLSRGLWSKTYSVREEGGSGAGGEWALSIALTRLDLPAGMGHLEPICREILQEEARLRSTQRPACLAPVEARFATSAGVPAMLAPRYADSFERRLSHAASLEEMLRLCVKLSEALVELQEVLPCHGNLRPAHIHLDERGQVLLSAPLTPIARKHAAELWQAAGAASDPYLPPEYQGGGSRTPAPSTVMDTYALGVMLYWGATASTEGASRPPDAALRGLDKSQLVALKDRIHARLKEERANPRFHTRLSDRFAAMLNRTLSEQTTPSPPYRFTSMPEFRERLQKLQALVNPSVVHVGRILLDRPTGSEAFTTDEEAHFSCTIGCSPGVESHEEIACGLALFDQDSGERLREHNASYTVDSHPSGRLRFSFRLGGLAPNSYSVRVAFTIRDSGDEPAVAEGRFEVRAAPGYVPPRPEPRASRPLPLPVEREGEPITQTHASRSAPASPDLFLGAAGRVGPDTARVDRAASGGEGVGGPAVRLPPPRSEPPDPTALPPRSRGGSPVGVAGVQAGGGAGGEVVELPGRDRGLPPLYPPPASAGTSPFPARRPPLHEEDDEEAEDVEPTSPQVQLTTSTSAPRRPPIERADTSKAVYDPEPEGGRDPYRYEPPTPRAGGGGRGTWESELPPPRYSADELYGEGQEELPADDPTDTHLPGPIGDALARLLEVVRGDTYTMYIVGGTILIVFLIVVLLIVR